jgi:hypothetical protein
MKRRDRVMECTIAAIAGIGIAAILTASLGVRSSGNSTPHKPEVATATSPSTVADVRPSKAARPASKHPVRKRHVRRHHRRTHVVTAPAAPVVAQAAPVETRAPIHAAPIRTQSVAPPPAPAPAPQPAPKAPSRPKPSGGGGVSFDDSG